MEHQAISTGRGDDTDGTGGTGGAREPWASPRLLRLDAGGTAFGTVFGPDGSDQAAS